jgi:redox-sensitive bicupin YhaK (pirin superfamily)
MIDVRLSQDRGMADFGWLQAKHSFSFGEYWDPKHMGFGPLRVINEDRIAASAGFDTHGHKNMEIITYILEGALEHKDSLGSGSVLRPGDVQRMRAGRGIRHSEFNHLQDAQTHLLQIWIEPSENGLQPGYEDRHFGDQRENRLALIASPDARDGSLDIHQDVSLYASVLDKGVEVTHELANGRKAWLQVAQGSVRLNGLDLSQGDGAAISDEDKLDITANEPSDILLFDMAG